VLQVTDGHQVQIAETQTKIMAKINSSLIYSSPEILSYRNQEYSDKCAALLKIWSSFACLFVEVGFC
jgi:hypothetical protein